MDSSDDWLCIVSVCNRCARRSRVGHHMISDLIEKWWRRRAAEPNHYVPFHFTGVTFQRADPAALDAEWTAEIMKRIASNKLFEIEYL
jgi:hypothetical protein